MTIKILGKSLKELKAEYGTGNGGFYNQSWYENEPFFTDKPEPGVYEINVEKKEFTNLTYDEQKKKLKKGFDFPHPVVVTEALLSHYKKTGKYLMKDWYTRTSLLASVGYRVNVGYCDAKGVDVLNFWVAFRDGHVGVGLSRKLSSIDLGTIDSLEPSDFESRISALESDMEKIRKFLII